MDLPDGIQLLAILVECAIAVIAVGVATLHKKTYGWFIALTFALFTLFDLLRIFPVSSLSDLHSLLLLVACVSMLYAVWLIFADTRK